MMAIIHQVNAFHTQAHATIIYFKPVATSDSGSSATPVKPVRPVVKSLGEFVYQLRCPYTTYHISNVRLTTYHYTQVSRTWGQF